MEESVKGTRNIFLIFALVSALACVGLGVLMNTRMGPGTAPVAMSAGQTDANVGVPTAPAEASPTLQEATPQPSGTARVAGPRQVVDESKLAPPATGCGLGDRYGVVCMDGTVKRGTSSYTCKDNGGVDYYLICR